MSDKLPPDDGSDDKVDVPSPEAEGDVDESISIKELEALIDGEELDSPEQYAQRQSLFREQGLKDAGHWALRSFVRAVGLIAIFWVAIWAFHMLAPMDWRWLTPEGVERLQTLLLSGGISALATIAAQRAFRD